MVGSRSKGISKCCLLKTGRSFLKLPRLNQSVLKNCSLLGNITESISPPDLRSYLKYQNKIKWQFCMNVYCEVNKKFTGYIIALVYDVLKEEKKLMLMLNLIWFRKVLKMKFHAKSHFNTRVPELQPGQIGNQMIFFKCILTESRYSTL